MVFAWAWDNTFSYWDTNLAWKILLYSTDIFSPYWNISKHFCGISRQDQIKAFQGSRWVVCLFHGWLNQESLPKTCHRWNRREHNYSRWALSWIPRDVPTGRQQTRGGGGRRGVQWWPSSGHMGMRGRTELGHAACPWHGLCPAASPALTTAPNKVYEALREGGKMCLKRVSFYLYSWDVLVFHLKNIVVIWRKKREGFSFHLLFSDLNCINSVTFPLVCHS